jgi:hypothetical protein
MRGPYITTNAHALKAHDVTFFPDFQNNTCAGALDAFGKMTRYGAGTATTGPSFKNEHGVTHAHSVG